MKLARPLCAALCASSLWLILLHSSRTSAQSEPLAQPSESAASAEVSEQPSVLQAAVRAMVSDSLWKDSVVGVALLDVDSGELLAAHNEHSALNPASNAKVYTAAAALSLLGPNHRYLTSLHGNVQGQNVDHLVLRGAGDPSLSTDDMLMLARDVYARGVRRVDGNILMDHRFFDDQTTPPAFEQQPNEWASFRAPVSAIAINENTVTLNVRPSAAGGNAVVFFEPPGFVDVQGTIKTGEPGASRIGLTLEGAGQRLSGKVNGTIASDTGLYRYARRVEDPRLLAGYTLKWALEQFGIKVAGEVKLGNLANAPQLASRQSKPLSTLLYDVGKQSNNFYAEMIFKSLSSEKPASSAAAAGVITRWLERNQLSDEGLLIKNGSGLFDANRVTASSMVRLLRHMWREPGVRAEFVAQLAVGGADGTLQKRFTNLRRARIVRAKTGTLDDTISLAGYVLGPTGHGPIAFAVLFNKVRGKGGGARAAADRLVFAAAEQLWRR